MVPRASFSNCCYILLVGGFGAIASTTVAADEPPGNVTEQRLVAADQEPQNWLTTGRDAGEQHFSPLDQINTESVRRLGLAWVDEANASRGRVHHRLEATPVVVDGTMYASGPWGVVYALDAATGKPRWRFDPEVDAGRARLSCCDPVNRGVAVWKGRVYVGQIDGWLVALDAADGKVLWKVDTFIDRKRGYSVTGAPRIAGGNIVIGNAGNEMGVRGYVTAYAPETGAQRWRFFTVPGDPKHGYEQPELEMAAKTWDSDAEWDAGGGGAVWDGMAYDPTLNLLYIGTGNGSPDPVWLRSPKETDNLFLSSILAISPDTGRLVWYYQATPGESWDFDATQPLILATLNVSGESCPVLMQANKNGFFYVLDRRTGKLLSAEKFVTTTWAKRVDSSTGRPVLDAVHADYRDSSKIVYPAPGGGHNWNPTAFSPLNHLVYIPAHDVSTVYRTNKDWHYRLNDMNWGANYVAVPVDEKSRPEWVQTDGHQPVPRQRELLLAWDPIGQRQVWRAKGGGGGLLATAGGLVFQGSWDGYFSVYRANDGKLLKKLFVGSAIIAAPMSYAVGGVQYVAVMAGGGPYVRKRSDSSYSNEGRILALCLDGGQVPTPAVMPAQPLLPLPPHSLFSVRALARGKRLFKENCQRCHHEGSEYPNLFNLPMETHAIFNKIVLRGLFSYGGMARFDDILALNDVEAIHAWLIEGAYREHAAKLAPPTNQLIQHASAK